MRPILIALLTAAAALPFLASCSATVEPDGYGYYDSGPVYGPAYYPYPRYHEYRPYHHPYYHHYDRHVVEHRGPEIHGHIAIER
jgi:hypothetical protein